MNTVNNFLDSIPMRYTKLRELTSKLEAIHDAAPTGDITTIEQAKNTIAILQSQERHLDQLKREADYEMQLVRTASDAALSEVDAQRLSRGQKKQLKDQINQARSQFLTQCQGYKNLVDQWLIQVADWKQQLRQYVQGA